MQTKNNKIFITKVWDFYTQNKRDFSWRKDIGQYKILLSEIMLQ
jgi:adenine-specific DNA glycosylase